MFERSPADMAVVPARSAGSHPSIGGHIGRVDGRSAVARRAKQLTADFIAALGGHSAVDSVLMAKVRRAAELVVVAERARVAALHGSAVALDDLVRVERLAELAVRRLGIDQREPDKPDLDDYLASKAGAP
jgi:hypothetical protein